MHSKTNKVFLLLLLNIIINKDGPVRDILLSSFWKSNSIPLLFMLAAVAVSAQYLRVHLLRKQQERANLQGRQAGAR